MTIMSRAMALVPAFVLASSCACFVGLAHAPSLGWAAALVYCVYGLPVTLYRLNNFFYPLEQGISYLDTKDYSSWWGGHQIQSFYIAFPFLEAALRLIPGVYSFWLRLWGSKVGSGVYWTPRVEIADRGMLEIGDRVLFGHKVKLFSHVIKPRRGRPMLYLRKITIGAGCFIGAGSGAGPGVVIEDGSSIPVFTDLYPNRRYNKETQDDAPAR